MLDKIPTTEEMTALVGKSLYEVWNNLCALIDEHYDMERLWDKGGKAWKYEYKYRRGGKTLCALYARENCVGFMVVLGKDEHATVLRIITRRKNFWTNGSVRTNYSISPPPMRPSQPRLDSWPNS